MSEVDANQMTIIIFHLFNAIAFNQIRQNEIKS